MAVMAFASRTVASRSTLSAVVPLKAGSLAASPVASEAAATLRLFHHAQLVQVALDLQEVASVVDSEVGLTVAAVASAVAAGAEAVSKTEVDMAAGAEVVSDTEAVDLVAVTEAGEVMAAIGDQTVAMVHHLLMLQLDQEVLDLASKVHLQEVSAPELMVRVHQIAMELLLREAQVGMILAAADHHTTSVDRLGATEAAIVVMVIAAAVVIATVEDIAQHRAGATWNQFVHASHAKTAAADIVTEIQEITTWV